MLMRHYARREFGSLIGWTVGLFAYVFPAVLIFQLMMNSDGMRELARVVEQLPAPLQAMFGGEMGLTSMNGWLTAQLFGLLLPLGLLLYTATASVSILTKEMDGRTMDFLLALPIRRSQVVLHRLTVLAGNLALLHFLMIGTIGLGVGLLGHEPNWRLYGLVMFNSYLMNLAVAGLMLTVTVFIDDYTRGILATVGLALFTFFFSVLLDAKAELAFLRKISLHAYYQPKVIMAEGALVTSDIAVLVVAAVALTGLGLWLFNRKQLSA